MKNRNYNVAIDPAAIKYAAERQSRAWTIDRPAEFYRQQLNQLAIKVRAGETASWTPEQIARLLDGVAAGVDWELGTWR